MKKFFYAITMFSFLVLQFFNSQALQAQVKGCDLSWVTEMEASGYTWKNSSGVTQDIFTICKGLGFNACRLRVWVNPSGGWSGQTDVVNKAKRAKAVGMNVMIDFHYSDTWADPANQTKPAAWSSHTISQLYTDVWNHTVAVLTAVKNAGVTPSWVQVGNETNNGMLWPEGKASTNMKQFAGLITSGYNGVKSVFSSAKVIVHVSNGYDNSLFRWMFDGLKTNAAKYDVIGMSLYPTSTNWSTLSSQCLTNMNDMKSRYGKTTMICEIGMATDQPTAGAAFFKDIRAKNTAAGGLGVFYWEPQAYSWKGYGLGAWDYSTKKPTGAIVNGLKSALEDNVAEVNANAEVIISPNPGNGQNIQIEIKGGTGQSIISIVNVNGQILKNIVADQNKVVLNDINLQTGIYFIKVTNDRVKEITTLVVK